jgi:CheY-like chemotaxis protein
VGVRGIHVLVVDEPHHAQILVRLLTAEGCETRIAHTAPEAIAVLSAFQAQAVILDLVLPGMSGLVLARILKADPATSNLVIVALSSVNGPAVERMAKDAGCAAWIRKPIDPLMFVQLLGSHLKGRS